MWLLVLQYYSQVSTCKYYSGMTHFNLAEQVVSHLYTIQSPALYYFTKSNYKINT